MLPTKIRFKDLSVGSTARIVNYDDLTASYRNRLMSLGLTPGTQFRVQNIAPLGDPVSILVRGSRLSFRWAEAGNILVEPL